MYTDLKLNSNGDLIFNEIDNSYRKQKILFNITDTKTQKIKFNFYNCTGATHRSNNYLKVDFEIKKDVIKYVATTLKDNEAKSQLIAIKLQTVFGELPKRNEFGSELSKFKHLNINDSNINKISSHLYELLKDDVDNLTIHIEPYIQYTNKYRQALNIYIYSKNDLLLNYIL